MVISLKIFRYHARSSPRIKVLVNHSDSVEQFQKILERLRQAMRVFLNKELEWARLIPSDSHVPESLRERNPFLLNHPYCPASEAVQQIARRLINQRQNDMPSFRFCSSLNNNQAVAVPS